ncbi:hypothetical protein Tco_0926645 [Tanacetum coccineum]|uniref:Uncharacterized protein n=1 Tax=Tanacetum coccineum TaxID=301880 RepID=A0ABQ5DDB7_9ASTR
MEDEHLDAIPATKSDEVIKSSVENLVQIPSESKGIFDGGCDVPLCDNPTPLEAFKEHSETIVDSNNDSTSSDDDYPYGEDIDYVDASPPDAEIVSLEVVESVIPEVGGVDTDILLTIKDDILREKLSPSPFPNSFLEETNTFDNSLTESETFRFNLEEISSGSTTTRSDYSLPDYEAFYLNDDHIEEKSSGSTTTHADFSLPKYDSFIFESLGSINRAELWAILTMVCGGDIYQKVNQSSFTPPYLLSCGNEDTIFDPDISVYHSFMPGVSHRSGTFMKFIVYPRPLDEKSDGGFLSSHLLPHGTNVFRVRLLDFEDLCSMGFVHLFELHILQLHFGTDIANITRKQSKPGKHEHGNGKSAQEPEAKPTEKHLHAAKRFFKYLRGTVNKGLWYLKNSSIALTAYADADHAGCQDTR